MLWGLVKKESRIAEAVNYTSQFLLCFALMPFFKLRARMKVDGWDNIRAAEQYKKEGRGIVFAINHVTELDVIIVVASIIFKFSPLVPIHYVSMEKEGYKDFSGIKKYLWGGWVFTLLGAYPVYRGKGDYEQALKNHIELLEAGKSVGIFPTGRMNKTTDWMHDEARGGVAYLAQRTNALIVPVRIGGLEGFSMKKFLQGAFRMRVTFGEPIEYRDIAPEDDSSGVDEYKAVAKRTVTRIASL
jgi:1-acyl-sn-glycerol-3-phosphate acyltransferase